MAELSAPITRHLDSSTPKSSSIVTAIPSTPSPEHSPKLYGQPKVQNTAESTVEAKQPEKFYTWDQVIRQRAKDEDQFPLYAFPKGQTVDDYEMITGKMLDRLIDGACKVLIEAGLGPVYEKTVIGVYSVSDLDYLINIFALGRLGYTSFLLSPRLPASAVSALLEKTDSTTLLHSPGFASIGAAITALTPERSIRLVSIPPRTAYDQPKHSNTPSFQRSLPAVDSEHMNPYIMLHSSGSTGLPKPRSYTNARMLMVVLTHTNQVAFQSLPFSHAHGLVTFSQAIWARKTLYAYNCHIPHTCANLSRAIRKAKPQIVWTVPYVLKLLCETEEGIDALKGCETVSSSGSRCPDEIGDYLTSKGIFLGLLFGSTEVSLIFDSLIRPRDDKFWDYLVVPKHVAPYLLMRPVSDDSSIYEAIILDGFRAKAVTNSQDPPNSYHTSDLFEAHPTLANRWKFVGRLDDRVTLLNGEKVLPLPMEGRIRKEPPVKEVVVFGIDRPIPGILLFRSDAARGLSDDEFLDKVWPAIEEANSNAESFAQISREMVVVLSEDMECSSTDKGSIKRAQVYKDYTETIDAVYARLEDSQQGNLQLNVEELQEWILKTFEEDLGVRIENVTQDFFSAGVDSLKAIQFRGLMVRTLDLAGRTKECSSLIVYECRNAEGLAKKLYELRTGTEAVKQENSLAVMESLINKYSTFQKHEPSGSSVSQSKVVVLTGATGSLGSHVLAKLIANKDVSKVYCLLRSPSDAAAGERLISVMEERKFAFDSSKVTALSSKLSDPDNLGLSSSALEEIKSSVTHILHCAWEVNFAVSVQSFEHQIQALHNLLSLSLAAKAAEPACLVFCSSISTAMATPTPALISEAPIPSLSQASATGYAQSKLVAERVIENAVAAGANAKILRIGQIVPSRSVGSQLWSPNEAVPLMIRSAMTTGALPEVMGRGGADSGTWVEADVLADTISQLSGIAPTDGEVKVTAQLVHNLVHPHRFSWRDELLPALKEHGLKFEIVSWTEWMKRLEASETDVEKNPSRKLLGFWKGNGLVAEVRGEVGFETKDTEAASEALRNTKRVVDGDMVGELLKAWGAVWR